ncbi:MAG: HlyD family secretion protein [Rickettsiaceae bacterium]|nr:HlyD family secretion protein [Rickettsiaceae bacterium]
MTQSTDNAYVEGLISEVSSEIEGTISKILITENNKVSQGDIIAYIDDKIYAANVKKSATILEKALKNLDVIKYKIKLAEIAYQKAQLKLKLSKENLRIVEQDFIRAQSLNKDNYSSQRSVDFAELNYLEAKNSLQQAALEVESSANNLQLLATESQILEADYEVAVANNIIEETNLKHTIIYAPISGIMTNSIMREGNLVRPGRTLFMIVPEKDLYIKANFKETQVKNFRENMAAEIQIDAIKNIKLTGTIRNLSPATGSKFALIPPQNATGNFTKIVQRVPVIIDFQVPEEFKNIIVPGMSCVVKIRTDR